MCLQTINIVGETLTYLGNIKCFEGENMGSLFRDLKVTRSVIASDLRERGNPTLSLRATVGSAAVSRSVIARSDSDAAISRDYRWF